MDKIIYGSIIADETKENIKNYIETLKENNQRIPHLVVILVGDNASSKSYVKGKNKDCIEVGIKNTTIFYPEISEINLISKIKELNDDDSVDGILVQLPLPKSINTDKIIEAINPNKDVDGFHPINVGNLYIGKDTFLPCTPKGVIRILEKIGYNDLSGKKVAVIGRSNIVGKPLSKLLMDKNATVITCHSKTKNIKSEVAQCDIVVSATGQAKMIKNDWLKDGAIVIDVGINRDENNKMCGDVDFEDVINKVKYITPVPRGVGLVTRAMLLENTIIAYQKNK